MVRMGLRKRRIELRRGRLELGRRGRVVTVRTGLKAFNLAGGL